MSADNPRGDILNPGEAERIVDQVVERRYLFKPKDEEVPPDGGNWFEHNYKPRPAALSIRIQIDPKALADALNPFIEQSNMAQVVKICQNAKIEVVTNPQSPIVELRLKP